MKEDDYQNDPCCLESREWVCYLDTKNTNTNKKVKNKKICVVEMERVVSFAVVYRNGFAVFGFW